MIQFFNENIPSPTLPTNITQWLTTLINNEEKTVGDINYIFCDDNYLLGINQQYLNHDYLTDIITFDYVKGKKISGDIFVSLQRISDNASKLNISADLELNRVLAHGLLHLCGYHDKTAEEQLLMRSKEDYYLKLL